MSNIKALKVNPDVENAAYIKGTTPGNYFLIVSDTEDGLVSFRPLSQAIPPRGSKPTAGVETRVRAVPSDAWGNPKLDRVMAAFGFRKTNGTQHVHYSLETSDPKKAIADAQLALEIAA